MAASAQVYDLVVAGAGMVGSAFALCCARSTRLSRSCRILVLEAGKSIEAPPGPETPWKNRVSAVSPSSKQLFEKLGVWDQIAKHRYGVIKQMNVWDSSSNSNIVFGEQQISAQSSAFSSATENCDSKPEQQQPDIAHVVENDLIAHYLAKEMVKYGAVETRFNTAIKQVRLPKSAEELVSVDLADGTTLTTKLIVGADGVNSLIRKEIGGKYISWAYDQKALVATLNVELTSEPLVNVVAWQRFTPTGPIALLPLSEKQSSLVWSTTPEFADRLFSLPPDQFVFELNDALESTYNHNALTNSALDVFYTAMEKICPMRNINYEGPMLPPFVLSVDDGSRACFPLGFGHSNDYVSHRAAVIGDAAHRVHPLAGQGVNLGFGDAECLTNILEEAVAKGSDIGSLNHLLRYESQRQFHNVPVMVTLDWLNRLYRTDWSPLVFARSLGLALVNEVNCLKDAIITRASA